MKKITVAFSTTLFGLLVLSACSSNTDNQATSSTDEPNHTHQNQASIQPTEIQEAEITHNHDLAMTDSNDVELNSQQPEGEVEIDVKSSTLRRHDHIETRTYSASIPKPKAHPELTNSQRFSGVLQAHNGVRTKHGLKPLTWSNKLADYSKQWANHLGRGNHCQIKHRGGLPPYGENLYRAGALEWSDGRNELLPVTIKNVVKAWTDEEKWYNHRSNSCQPGQKCGHYTQVVWKKTTEVGCAVKICPDKSQTWVCSYNPPGNFQGVRPY